MMSTSETSNSNPSTVFVVDDDASVRRAIGLLLDAAGYQFQTFASAEAFLEQYSPPCYGCLLLDVRMPGMDGLALHRHLTTKGCKLPTIFLTAHGDVPMAVSALKSGAIHFAEKPIDDKTLLEHISTAMTADRSREIAEAEVRSIRESIDALTERERQILDMLAEGKAVKVIAMTLGTSHNTVRNQRASILNKMSAESAADLVRMVMTLRQVESGLSHDTRAGPP